jgi:hypothetical protein
MLAWSSQNRHYYVRYNIGTLENRQTASPAATHAASPAIALSGTSPRPTSPSAVTLSHLPNILLLLLNLIHAGLMIS